MPNRLQLMNYLAAKPDGKVSLADFVKEHSMELLSDLYSTGLIVEVDGFIKLTPDAEVIRVKANEEGVVYGG